MPRYIALLRAINVGGHTVTMERLRALFTDLGFANVETFIASGNVIFESRASAAALERRIEARLLEALGYEVTTFLRTDAEIGRIAAYRPFPEPALKSAAALNVAFLTAPPGPAARSAIEGFRNDIDDFHFHGRELYWLCRKRQSESRFSNAAFERTLKLRATFRSINTVRKLSEKYPAR
jgi:uncharacterized protein (DUF1697 family)